MQSQFYGWRNAKPPFAFVSPERTVSCPVRVIDARARSERRRRALIARPVDVVRFRVRPSAHALIERAD